MPGQILTKLETVEKELKEIKNLLKKKGNKTVTKKSTLAGLWKGFKISDEELEEARYLSLTEITKRLKSVGEKISPKEIADEIAAYRSQR